MTYCDVQVEQRSVLPDRVSWWASYCEMAWHCRRLCSRCALDKAMTYRALRVVIVIISESSRWTDGWKVMKLVKIKCLLGAYRATFEERSSMYGLALRCARISVVTVDSNVSIKDFIIMR